VRSQIAEAQKIAGGSGSEQDIAEAKIELEVGITIASNVMSKTDRPLGFGDPSGPPQIGARVNVL